VVRLGGESSVLVGVSDMKNAQKIKHALRRFGLGSLWERGVFGEVARPELGAGKINEKNIRAGNATLLLLFLLAGATAEG